MLKRCKRALFGDGGGFIREQESPFWNIYNTENIWLHCQAASAPELEARPAGSSYSSYKTYAIFKKVQSYSGCWDIKRIPALFPSTPSTVFLLSPSSPFPLLRFLPPGHICLEVRPPQAHTRPFLYAWPTSLSQSGEPCTEPSEYFYIFFLNTWEVFGRFYRCPITIAKVNLL